LLVIAYGFGAKILNLIRISVEKIEQFIFSVALGFGIIGILVFGFGLVEKLQFPVLFAVLVIGILVSYQETKKLILGIWQNKKLEFHWATGQFTATLYILVIFLLSFFSALTPCTESDALRYHLAVPQFYLDKQGIFYDPYNAFSNFPFLIEMLYTLGLAITGTILPKLMHWSFFFLTGLTIYSFTKRFFKETNPLIPVAIFVSTPFIPIISFWAFIETGLTFYVFLALYALCLISDFGRSCAKASESKFRISDLPTSYCLLFSIFTGFLLSIKYSMVAVVFFLWLIFIILVIKRFSKRKKLFLLLTSCFLLLFFVSIPWYLKSYIYTGNPVYPLGYSVFGGADWSQFNAEFYASHAQAKGWLAESAQQNSAYRVAELFWLPWQATMNPPKSAMQPVNFGDWQLGPIFLAFLLLTIFIIIKKFRDKSGFFLPSSLLLLASFYFIFWSATYRDNRFLLPILPILSILIAWSINQLRIADCGLRKNKDFGFWLLAFGFTIVLWLMLVYNAFWMTQTVAKYHNPFSFILGRESKEQYLTRKLDYYPMFQYLNRETPQNEHILFIGEYRPLYCHRPYYCSDFFDTPVILRLIQQSETVDQLKEKLAEMQVKYILYNEKELRLYFPYFRQRFNSIAELELFQSFISDPDLAPIYTDPRGMTVYQ
ncbi:MAG: hypothetical protein QME64_11255, partial [bacterium]|nr:hypothetical protein [bacterium]